jgi:hypothetical protein
VKTPIGARHSRSAPSGAIEPHALALENLRIAPTSAANEATFINLLGVGVGQGRAKIRSRAAAGERLDLDAKCDNR